MLSYSILFIVTSYSMRKTKDIAKSWRHTKIFYVSILMQLAIRVFSFGLILWAVPDKSTIALNFLFLLLSLPDSFFMISYFLLSLQMLSIFYQSHMENDIHISLIFQFTKPRHRGETRVTAIAIFIWITVQSLLYLLLFNDVVTMIQISLEYSIFNILLASIELLIFVQLFKKFNFTPLKSTRARKRLSTISKRLLLWTCGRFIKGIFGLHEYQSDLVATGIFLHNGSQMHITILFVISLFVSEIFCYSSVVG